MSKAKLNKNTAEQGAELNTELRTAKLRKTELRTELNRAEIC